MKVSAVIPSRGDAAEAVEHLRQFKEIEEIVVIQAGSVFGRYIGIDQAKNEIIYTQDDDCITDVAAVLGAYKPGVVVNAMTPEHARQYPRRATLVGFGAIFDRNLIRCLDGWERDELFMRECDRVFTALNRCEPIFPEIQILPRASDPDRLWKQAEHNRCRLEIESRILAKTGIAA
jgi:hypothetical protein